MNKKTRSVSSKVWLKEHFNDKYVQEAHRNKLRSRAWFKIYEIHQCTKNIFKPGMNVVDLGSAPGSWSQYVVNQISPKGSVIACDLISMLPIGGVEFLQGDFCDKEFTKVLMKKIDNKKIQVIMSDMAPNICGISAIDIPRSIHLAELALDMCREVLVPCGNFIVKIFQGDGFDEYLQKIHSLFRKIKICKPNASRLRSREVYVVAIGYK